MRYDYNNYEATRVLQTIQFEEDGTQIEKHEIRRNCCFYIGKSF